MRKGQAIIEFLMTYGWVILVVLAALGALLYFSPWKDTTSTNNTISIEEVQNATTIEAKLRAQYQPDRQYGYGNFQGKQFIISEVFKELPTLPNDFWKAKSQVMEGRSTAQTLCDLYTEYYVQPEFYRDGFLGVGLNVLKNPDPTHWTPEGYGTYPHEIEAYTFAGEDITVCTFFHTSFGVETYQGFTLVPVYPSTTMFDGKSIPINSSASERYVSISIEPNVLLLEPAYLIFREGWTRKIRMQISVRNDTPPGIYSVGFDVARAPTSNTIEWITAYGASYKSKSNIGISEPQFIMTIRVQPDEQE